MPDVNPPVSFRHLVEDCQHIEVPLIQRDYAQGRESQKDVRNDFVGALMGALLRPIGDSKLPLNLDFVYGSMEVEGSPRFLPLDGQQRLSTLFLLHWYLAWRDNQLPEFRALFWDGRHSRFTYSVRPSSTEFFDALVEFVPAGTPDDNPSVSRMLEDQSWYFLNWRLDPTIQGVLTMLDTIHDRFRESDGLYARLVDMEKPAITFHVLRLEHFGLSDDLYIKMNARGKPLTTFETFKARFEELLKELFPTGTRRIADADVSVPKFFERRMDSQWTDFFWSHQHATFDAAVLNLIWALIRVSLEPASRSFVVDTSALGGKQLGAGFTLFHERGWLTQRFANQFMDILEAWSAGGGKLSPQLPGTRYFDELAFFERAIEAPWALRYFELVQFAALVFYLSHHPSPVDKDALQEWMRVVSNLAANSDIERPEEFGRGLAGLQKLASDGDRILQRLTEPDVDVSGFSSQQLREESLKATLILSRPGWRERIDAAESHGYFQGQIEFLLKFSGVLDRWLENDSIDWSDAEDANYQAKFTEYFVKASAVFSEKGLNEFSARRWERALLVKGDYLLQRGINRSFLDDRARDASWKRLLRGSFKSDQAAEEKRQFVRELFDEMEVDNGVEKSLDTVLAKPLPVEPWRRAVIEHAEIIDYCSDRNIRWHQDGNIYLMRSIRMSGEHAELFSLHLKSGLLLRKHKSGELFPFGSPQYQSVSGEATNPSAYLEWRHDGEVMVVSFVHSVDSYFIWVQRRGGPIADVVREIFVGDAEFVFQGDGSVWRKVERGHIEAVLDEIVLVARRLSQLPSSAWGLNSVGDDAPKFPHV